MLGQTKFVGSEFLEGLGGFIVRFCWMNLGSEGFEVQFFQIWAWVCPVSGRTGSKSGFLEGSDGS